MTDTTSIPLSKLTAWDGNVRKTAGADTSLAELSASIAAHGLLQSLIVRKGQKGKYAVVAGGRRLQALKMLASHGKIPADYAVRCHLISDEADATEISLAENAVREQMHPADEFEAFQALSDKMPLAEIAARFGVTEKRVLQRLRLARVSPVLLQAYRDGETTLDCLMAFAVTDDRDAQERLWASAPAWLKTSARQIRDTLTAQSVTAGDRRVAFVTLEAYEKAGGVVRRDLFCDDEDGIFIEDLALLETLVAEKLQTIATSVLKDGWKWAEIRQEFDASDWSHCGRVFQETVPLSEADSAELARLEQEADAFYDIEGELDDETQARFEAISARLDALSDCESVWTEDAKAIAGAVVCLGYDGEPEIRYGFVKPEDQPETDAVAGAKARTVVNEDSTVTEVDETRALPAALIEDLSRHKTAAIGAELSMRPDIALAALVHTLASQAFLGRASGNTCLEIFATETSLRRVEGTPAFEALKAAQVNWDDRIPGSPDALWQWCLGQDQSVLLDLLAFCLARTVNAVRAKSDLAGDPRFAHADRLAATLALDPAKWFTPTAENYFGRISKAGILDALLQAKGAIAPAWTKLKKADLAALAEREISGTGWLPESLRSLTGELEDGIRSAA